MPEGGRERLIADGLLAVESGVRTYTTARAKAALARAALLLQRAGAPWRDLRLPLAAVLAERYPELPDAELADLVEVMLPVVTAELPPLFGERSAAPEP